MLAADHITEEVAISFLTEVNLYVVRLIIVILNFMLMILLSKTFGFILPD